MADTLGPWLEGASGEGDVESSVYKLEPLILNALSRGAAHGLALFAYNPDVAPGFSRSGSEGQLFISDTGDLQIQQGNNRVLVRGVPERGKLRLDPDSIKALEDAIAAINKIRDKKYVSPPPRPVAEGQLIQADERWDEQTMPDVCWPIIRRYNRSRSQLARQTVKIRLQRDWEINNAAKFNDHLGYVKNDFESLAMDGSDSEFAVYYHGFTLEDFKEIYWILYGERV